MKINKKLMYFCFIIFNISQVLGMGLRVHEIGLDLNVLANMSESQKNLFYANWYTHANRASDAAKRNIDSLISGDIKDLERLIKIIETDADFRESVFATNPKIIEILQKKIDLLESLREPFKMGN